MQAAAQAFPAGGGTGRGAWSKKRGEIEKKLLTNPMDSAKITFVPLMQADIPMGV
jgi:hypothetical protein